MTSARAPSCAISVLICTHNRRHHLLETLDSLALQEWNGIWEVLVIDNRSQDGTTEAVRSHAEGFPVPLRVVGESQVGLSFARNRAVQAASGRVALFIDDDVTCLPGWLAAHARVFEDLRVVGTGGRILPVLPAAAPLWWNEVLPHEIGGPTSRYDFGHHTAEIVGRGPIPPPFGANMGILRQWVLDLGGFRTDLGWGRRLVPSEELEFFRRAQARTAKLLYVPDACVEHRIEQYRTTWEYYVRWQRGKGRSGVIIDPPRGPIARVSAILGCLTRILVASLRARSRRDKANRVAETAALRKLERLKGRLSELVGL
jgi:glycosyltransferase involved in cell wall biosynthesis